MAARRQITGMPQKPTARNEEAPPSPPPHNDKAIQAAMVGWLCGKLKVAVPDEIRRMTAEDNDKKSSPPVQAARPPEAACLPCLGDWTDDPVGTAHQQCLHPPSSRTRNDVIPCYHKDLGDAVKPFVALRDAFAQLRKKDEQDCLKGVLLKHAASVAAVLAENEKLKAQLPPRDWDGVV